VSLVTSEGKAVLPGDIAVTQMAGPIGRGIRVAELLNGEGFHDFEHAFCYVGGPDDLILEAEPHAARLVPFAYPMNTCLWTSGIPAFALSFKQQSLAPLVANRYVGVGYSFLDYAALIMHRLNINVPGLQPYIASSGHMICSQLADQFRFDLGSHLFADGRWPGYVTPASLANLIESEMAK
jgi:hypothetical protein